MRTQQLLPLCGLLLASVTIASKLDHDDVPNRCWPACGPVVGIANSCDARHERDSAEIQCICDWDAAKTQIPLCAACITQYQTDRRNNNTSRHDHDYDRDNDNDIDDDDNEALDLVRYCKLTTTTYNSAAATTMGTSTSTAGANTATTTDSSNAATGTDSAGTGGTNSQDTMSKFPEVQGGGSLIIAWQIRDKHVLVVGGGEVAAGRILHALNADARVTVVCPAAGLNEEVNFRVTEKQVTHIDRNFEPSDLDNVDMVLCAIDDPEASTQVWKLCKERRIIANIADVPPECDFYFGSVHRDGPLQVMVSTNGNGPKLASIVRKKIAETLPTNMGAAIENVGKLRKKLREVAPNPDQGPKRMKWMSGVCETWSLDELVQMTEEDMDSVLSFYELGKIPALEEVRNK